MRSLSGDTRTPEALLRWTATATVAAAAVIAMAGCTPRHDPLPLLVERTDEGYRVLYPVCAAQDFVMFGAAYREGDDYKVLRHEGTGGGGGEPAIAQFLVTDETLAASELTPDVPVDQPWAPGHAPLVRDLATVFVLTDYRAADFQPSALGEDSPWLVWGELGYHDDAAITSMSADSAMAVLVEFCEQ